MNKSYLLITCFVLLTIGFTKAQNVSQNTGWSAFIHSQKLSEKTGIHFDFQVRSADDYESVRNILIRPGFTYFFNKKINSTLGYAYILTNERLIGAPDNTLSEHRIWQQLVYNQKIGKIPLAHRFRLEQRFIERNTTDAFSQRFRYFFRSVIPLKKQETFTKGAFAALQNEVFLTIQNKDELNNHVFDQNRAYLAIGYRFNPKIDLEAGYMNQYVKGLSNYTTNNILQLALYTRF